LALRIAGASEPIGAIEADRARIQRHLADVERELRARDVNDMPEDLRRARAANLDRLHEYWVKGVFPHNDSFVGRRVPFFIDTEGRACAVAYLALESGGTEAAHEVAAGMNNARVHDMTSPALGQWLAHSGLTLEEAARIQPDYCFCPNIESPVCGGDGNTYYNECVARVCGGLTVSCCGACPGNPTPVTFGDCGVCPDVSNCVGCDCPLGATTTIECPTSTTSTTSESTTTTSTTLPQSGPSNCTGKKFNIAGKKVRSRAKCYSKAVTDGTNVDKGCLEAARDRFSTAWTQLEPPGNDCLVSGDVTNVENLVDAFTEGLVTALDPAHAPSRCTGKKLLVAAKKAASETKCHGKAATKGVDVDGACLGKASDKFASSWAKLEVPPNDCLTTGDVADIENEVDVFVRQLVGQLEP